VGERPKKAVTTPATRERRVGIRVDVDAYIRVALVHATTGRKVHGWVRNLSAGGLFVETREPLAIEEPVVVDALARSGETALHLKVEGWVAYSGPDGMGIQFGPLSPAMAERVADLIERFG